MVVRAAVDEVGGSVQPRSVFTAGEVSGDRLAAPVLESLQRHRPSWSWTGFGGDRLDGLPSFAPLGRVEDLSGSGVAELLPALPRLLRGKRALEGALSEAPELAVFVDAPDLHLPLARRARLRGTRTVLIVAPQTWAWRPNRLERLGEAIDLVLCLFPFEVEPLRRAGIAAHWIGHPVVELARDQQAGGRPVRLSGPVDAPAVAVLPGSRPHEVRRHLAPMVAAARLALSAHGTGVGGVQRGRILVPWRLDVAPPTMEGVEFVQQSGPWALERADVALVAAGTAALEAAVLAVPSVVVVSAHPITAALARRGGRTP
ncbi:MAG TPA: hypothetical protein DIU15_08060, partial [Deltaproteobacteria bacterium]|nr:hypothetical protein [Deltaproteobacteria bacterium]